MVCVSVPFTKLHEHAYTILLLLWWYKCVLSTNKLWELNLLQGMHSIAQLSFVRKSLFISELHEHAYSHCSLLWCEMGVFLPTIYQIVGVVSLFHTCLQSLTHPSI